DRRPSPHPRARSRRDPAGRLAGERAAHRPPRGSPEHATGGHHLSRGLVQRLEPRLAGVSADARRLRGVRHHLARGPARPRRLQVHPGLVGRGGERQHRGGCPQPALRRAGHGACDVRRIGGRVARRQPASHEAVHGERVRDGARHGVRHPAAGAHTAGVDLPAARLRHDDEDVSRAVHARCAERVRRRHQLRGRVGRGRDARQPACRGRLGGHRGGGGQRGAAADGRVFAVDASPPRRRRGRRVRRFPGEHAQAVHRRALPHPSGPVEHGRGGEQHGRADLVVRGAEASGRVRPRGRVLARVLVQRAELRLCPRGASARGRALLHGDGRARGRRAAGVRERPPAHGGYARGRGVPRREPGRRLRAGGRDALRGILAARVSGGVPLDVRRGNRLSV
ncbi:MAG: putative esterase, partial [uncultured Gemmatimonadetes bacterium]